MFFNILTMKLNIILALLSICLIATSCTQSGSSEIAELEKKVAATPNKDDIIELERSYVKFVKKNPSNKDWCGRYLYRAAGINYQIQNFKKAEAQLIQGIEEFKSSKATPNSAVLLAKILDENFRKKDEATKYYKMVYDEYKGTDAWKEAELFFLPNDERLLTFIDRQEKKLAENPGSTGINLDAATGLRKLYKDYIAEPKADADTKSDVLLKSAVLNMRTSNLTSATANLKQIIDEPAFKKNKPEALLSLADIYENDLNRYDDAKTVSDQFIKEFPDHKSLSAAKEFSLPMKDKILNKIKNLEAEIYSKEQKGRLDRRKASRLINAYEAHAKELPNDPNTPEYLYKAGEVARSINDFNRALSSWEKIYSDYRSFKKAPQALFLQGFIYENDFKDLDKAKKVYKEFLSKYPKHDLTDDVQFSLKHLGKPADEIIQGFSKKQPEGK